MAGINNKYEYRSGLLNSLKVQHTASDVRNEDEYRKKVLNGLGVEYTDDDINQKNLYRAKVVEGLASSGGGGGSSDFSTAEVTIIKKEESPNGLILPAISDDTCEIQQYQSGIYTVPLYKGSLFIMDMPNLGIIESVSGDIEEVGEGKDYYYRIFGDCTITIS